MLNLCSLMHDNSFHPIHVNDDELHHATLGKKHKDSDPCQQYYRQQAARNNWVAEHFKHIDEIDIDLF